LDFEGADAFGVLQFEGFVVEPAGSGVEGGVLLVVVVVLSGVDDDSAEVLVAVVELQADFEGGTISPGTSSSFITDSSIAHDHGRHYGM
jgi:hypothetical protein